MIHDRREDMHCCAPNINVVFKLKGLHQIELDGLRRSSD